MEVVVLEKFAGVNTSEDHIPSLAIGGGCNGAAPEDGLVLGEVLLTTGEDGAVVYKEFARDVGIGDHNIELVADEERVERTELLRPSVQSALRVIREVRETEKRAGRNRIAVLVDQVFTEEERKDNVQDARN